MSVMSTIKYISLIFEKSYAVIRHIKKNNKSL